MKIKNIKPAIFVIGLVMVSALSGSGFCAEPAVQNVQKSLQPQIQQEQIDCVISPLEAVKYPAKYLNKNISFTGEFVSYTSLGLDYKPAFRDGTKYVGILIRRDDVKDHVIPLSEMKILVKRETAEKNADLEAGDKVKITGTVFSNALGDPWVDVKTFAVAEKKKKDKDNNKNK